MPGPYYGDKIPGVGTRAAQPTSGLVTLDVDQFQSLTDFKATFIFTAARIPVTDAAGSGSSGSLLLFTFNQGAVKFHASQQSYTAFAEGSALTGGAGDAAFVIGAGSTAAVAADGNLATTTQDIVTKSSTITLSGGTGVLATQVQNLAVVLDGTATPVALYLNWSGSAATIDANSYIDVTGYITVSGQLLSDD